MNTSKEPQESRLIKLQLRRKPQDLSVTMFFAELASQAQNPSFVMNGSCVHTEKHHHPLYCNLAAPHMLLAQNMRKLADFVIKLSLTLGTGLDTRGTVIS